MNGNIAKICIEVAVLGIFTVASGQQQPFDFGDAPEGALAYPYRGVNGGFPTCITVGPSLWIQHNNFGAWFGPAFDMEPDGNAGTCPIFTNLYDQDECFNDGDAGLLVPPAFTIVGPAGSESVVPCTGTGGSLGGTCQIALWGVNVDIQVVNNMPNQTVGYVNVLMDWDHNGLWTGFSNCAGTPVPEHVLVNFPIPNTYNGPLSALGPPPFQIGPDSGYVWTRFTITPVQLVQNWDGSGQFEDGESEDYLLRVDDLDFGDAPDPNYPTLLAGNGACHAIVPNFFLGAGVDPEVNGQQSADASGDDVLDGNDDEDGVVFITSPLLQNSPATVQVTASAGGLLDAWIDYNANGSWGDAGEQIFANQPLVAGANNLNFNVPAGASTGNTFARFRFSNVGNLSPGGYAPDGEVEDYIIDIQVPVELSSFTASYHNDAIHINWSTQSETENLGFHLYRSEFEESYYRKITRTLIQGVGNTSSVHHYSYIDKDFKVDKTYYYKLADISYDGVLTMHGPVQVTVTRPEYYELEQNYPNPFNPETHIVFRLTEPGFTQLIVYNIQGQKVRELVSRNLNVGRHSMIWDGKDDSGNIVPSGVYMYILQVNDFRQTKKMNFIK